MTKRTVTSKTTHESTPRSNTNPAASSSGHYYVLIEGQVTIVPGPHFIQSHPWG